MIWMTRVYHYVYYRTYYVISKTNKIIPEISSAQLLSISILLNVVTIYFFLKEPFSTEGFYVFFINWNHFKLFKLEILYE